MLAPVKEVLRHLRHVHSPPLVRSLTEMPQHSHPDPHPTPETGLPVSASIHEPPSSSPNPVSAAAHHGLMSSHAQQQHESQSRHSAPYHPADDVKSQDDSSQHRFGPGSDTLRSNSHQEIPSDAAANLREQQQQQPARPADSTLKLGKSMPALRHSLKRAGAWLESHGHNEQQQQQGNISESSMSPTSAESVDVSFRNGVRGSRRQTSPKPTGTVPTDLRPSSVVMFIYPNAVLRTILQPQAKEIKCMMSKALSWPAFHLRSA